MFDITDNSASLSYVRLDWTNGPASRSADQNITGLWTFTGGASFSTNATNLLNIEGTATGAADASQIAGVFASYSFTNATTNGYTFGNRLIVNVNNTSAASGSIGQLIRVKDNTSLSNTIRGLEVQTWTEDNTDGINTAIQAYGKTFGINAVTDGLAGRKAAPAAVFADLQNATNGNAIRAYSSTATSADLVSIFQTGQDYTGDALMIDMASGSANRFDGNFILAENANNPSFRVDSVGNTYINVSQSPAGDNALCSASALASASQIFDCDSGGSDLAENFGTQDDSIEARDLVVFTGEAFGIVSSRGTYTSKAWIKKSSQAYQGNILGVISTDPNQLYADDGVFAPEENPRPVTLVGRVPVKVNLQNGPVKTGDRITASDIPGIGMKADRPGMTLGIALNSLDTIASHSSHSTDSTNSQQAGSGQADSGEVSSYGEVIVFVNPGFWVPTITASGSEQAASGSVEFVYSGMSMGDLFDSIIAKFANMFEIVFEKGIIRVAELISDRLTSKELCLEDVCISRDQLEALLNSSGVPGQSGNNNSGQGGAPIDNGNGGNPNSTPTPTPLATPELTAETGEPTPTPEVTPTPEPTPEVTPESTSTPTPLATPELTAEEGEPTPTPSVSPTPTPTPSLTPTPSATPTPTPLVSSTPEPTPEITPLP